VPQSNTRHRRRWLRWAIAAVVVLVVLFVGGPFVYIHFIEGSAPPKLALPKHQADVASEPLSGTCHVADGSVVGYRVNEVLFGQNNTAVGRTSSVTGQAVINGDTVESGSVTVAMSTVKSNESARDAQFRGRIMDVSTYPTATFQITKPIVLPSVPQTGVITQVAASGNLTLHGQTRPVTATLNAQRTPTGFEVQGDLPVTFSDYGIPDPSFAGSISVQNHGIMELLLVFAKSGSTTTPSATTTTTQSGGSGPITVPATTVPPLTLNGR
jgi:polyisoprenoid-binding protein YceI